MRENAANNAKVKVFVKRTKYKCNNHRKMRKINKQSVDENVRNVIFVTKVRMTRYFSYSHMYIYLYTFEWQTL